MDFIISFTVLAVAATLANLIQHYFAPKISASYFCMLLGCVIAVVPAFNHLIGRFNPDLFMGLIVAPLLFFEGQAIRMNRVVRNWRMIVGLTVFMVLICAIAATASVYWLVGSLPLAVILGALSTPTDATASESVTNGLVMPEEEEQYLKMESLFNDASGIILLNMGILWYIRGRVQVGQTLWSFLYSAIGGILVGLVISVITVWFSQLLIRQPVNFSNRDYHNTPVKVLYLLTPFLVYYLAEEAGVSGIIAVVCAGLVHNAGAERSRLTNPEVLYDTQSIADVVNDTLNGVVFVILGVSMIRYVKTSLKNPSWDWLWVGLALYLANLLVRYLYVRLVHRQDNYHAWVFALGGIHGAVTFALAYTVANTAVATADVQEVVMSIIVLIIVSLLIPTILFQLLLPSEPHGWEKDKLIQRIREKMVQKGIDRVQSVYLPPHLRRLVLFDLNAQMSDTTMREFTKQWLIDVRQPDLTDDERLIFYQAYRLAFRAELDYLSEIEQQRQEFRPAIIHLYREILMAQMLVFDTNN